MEELPDNIDVLPVFKFEAQQWISVRKKNVLSKIPLVTLPESTSRLQTRQFALLPAIMFLALLSSPPKFNVQLGTYS